MNEFDEKQLKSEIDEITKRVDQILEKIDSLDPRKKEPHNPNTE